MNLLNQFLDNIAPPVGRLLMGVYFILPGIAKITGFDATAQAMSEKGMFWIPFFLVLTIIIQIGGGLAMIVGYKTRLVAFVLAGLVLIITVVMHNFWALPAGIEQAHETQNFFKNMGIMAGLLVMAGIGGGAWSLDNRFQQ